MGISEVVLFIKNGMPYIPYCTSVGKINVLETTDQCYEDIAIEFFPSQTPWNKRTGFLHAQGIISQSSKLTSCETNDLNLVMKSASKLIKRRGSTVVVEEFDQSLSSPLVIPIFQHSLIKTVFEHNNLITNGSSLFEEINDFFGAKEGDDIFYVKSNEYSKSLENVKNSDGPIDGILNWITSTFDFTKNTLWIIFISIISLVGLYIILKIVCLFRGTCHKPKIDRNAYLMHDI
jgi:hypothetical protein